MMKKISIVLIAAVFIFLAPVYAYSGACDPSPEHPEERLIDGPANVRDMPTDIGKIVARLPNHKKVKVTKHEIAGGQDWYFIEWTEGGKKKSGWTFIGNIICD